MDVFGLRDQLIDEYSRYSRSFIQIRDAKIAAKVNEELASGHLWPEPLIQLNPAFRPGKLIDELVEEGVLHQECGKIFCRGKSETDGTGAPLRLHQHQEDAIRAARGGHNYALTTGTGSGKSLAYIVPIVDYVLREGSGKGIRAIVVYPMNALANSQEGELEKFLMAGYPPGQSPVRFKRYTGQEKDEERKAIWASPPDIILTNYVMLELMLTRPQEKPLIQAARNLRFLVLDELHTYRGRQGADVALLVRRTRENLCRLFDRRWSKIHPPVDVCDRGDALGRAFIRQYLPVPPAVSAPACPCQQRSLRVIAPMATSLNITWVCKVARPTHGGMKGAGCEGAANLTCRHQECRWRGRKATSW